MPLALAREELSFRMRIGAGSRSIPGTRTTRRFVKTFDPGHPLLQPPRGVGGRILTEY
jgi:hypothetical protein